MTGALPAASTGGPGSVGAAAALQNRFHVAALAFQRARQLQNGARPRVVTNGHKHLRVAVLEALADTLSWTTV